MAMASTPSSAVTRQPTFTPPPWQPQPHVSDAALAWHCVAGPSVVHPYAVTPAPPPQSPSPSLPPTGPEGGGKPSLARFQAYLAARGADDGCPVAPPPLVSLSHPAVICLASSLLGRPTVVARSPSTATASPKPQDLPMGQMPPDAAAAQNQRRAARLLFRVATCMSGFHFHARAASRELASMTVAPHRLGATYMASGLRSKPSSPGHGSATPRVNPAAASASATAAVVSTALVAWITSRGNLKGLSLTGGRSSSSDSLHGGGDGGVTLALFPVATIGSFLTSLASLSKAGTSPSPEPPARAAAGSSTASTDATLTSRDTALPAELCRVADFAIATVVRGGGGHQWAASSSSPGIDGRRSTHFPKLCRTAPGVNTLVAAGRSSTATTTSKPPTVDARVVNFLSVKYGDSDDDGIAEEGANSRTGPPVGERAALASKSNNEPTATTTTTTRGAPTKPNTASPACAAELPRVMAIAPTGDGLALLTHDGRVFVLEASGLAAGFNGSVNSSMNAASSPAKTAVVASPSLRRLGRPDVRSATHPTPLAFCRVACAKQKLIALTRDGRPLRLLPSVAASPTLSPWQTSCGSVPARTVLEVVPSFGVDVFYVVHPTRQLYKQSWQPRHTSTPRRVIRLTEASVAVVSAGYHFVCAIDDLGRLWVFGWNDEGQLGIARATSLVTYFRVHPTLETVCGFPVRSGTQSPRRLVPPGERQRFLIGIACGYAHTVLLDASGDVLVAGANTHGQVGLPMLTNSAASADASYKFRRLSLPLPCAAVSAGFASTACTLCDGSLWVLGDSVGSVPTLISPARLRIPRPLRWLHGGMVRGDQLRQEVVQWWLRRLEKEELADEGLLRDQPKESVAGCCCAVS